MKSYVPEWKLYLWKKLILDQNDPERFFRPGNFVFFTEQQQRGLTLAHMQKTTDAIQDCVYRIRMGVSGQMVETYDNTGTPLSDQYYKSEPQQILLALIDLAEENPPCLEIKDIELRKFILDKYRDERRKHVSMQERKSLAAGHGRGSSKPDNYLTDPFCGLPEHIYKKVDAGEKLTLKEFEELIRKIPGESVYSSLCFKMQIDKPALEAKLNAYLHDFEAGDLTAPHGAQYFDPQMQRKSVYAAIKAMTANFGTKNLKITPEKIEAYGAWEKGMEQYYRIFETLFSLEKTGELSIKNILESEVIVSLADDNKSVKTTPEIAAMQDAARENFDREYNSFGIKREVVEQARQSSEHRQLIKTVENAVANSTATQQPKPVIESEKEKSKKIDGTKIHITINEEKKKISRESNGKILDCSFRKVTGRNKRFEYIVALAKNSKKMTGSMLDKRATPQQISMEIEEVNGRLRDALKLTKPACDFIINDNNSGYELNENFFTVEMV